MSMTMLLPVLPDERVFHVDKLSDSNSFVGGDYGATYLYQFGLNGQNLNMLDIYVPAESEYDDTLDNFFDF